MPYLTEETMNVITFICESKGDEAYWPLVQSYFDPQTGESEKKRIMEKILVMLGKDLAKHGDAMVKRGYIDYPEEVMTAAMFKFDSMMKSFWENNKNATGPVTGFIALAKTSTQRWLMNQQETEVRARDRISYEKEKEQELRRPDLKPGMKALLGKEEKYGVRQAILTSLTKLNDDEAKFIKELIGFVPSKEYSVDDISKLMKKKPDKIIDGSGRLRDTIAPGDKGMGFQRGSGKQALMRSGASIDDRKLGRVISKFSKLMCKALSSMPMTSHLFVDTPCEKLITTEAVSLLFGVPSAYLTEETANDIVIRFCIEALKD